MDDILGSPQIYLVLLTAFAVPVIMSIVGYFKREGAVDTKTALADVSVKSLQSDLVEVKSDVKQMLIAMANIGNLKGQIDNLAKRMDIVESIDKDMAVMKVRTANIEEKLSEHLAWSRQERKNGGSRSAT